jgi:hypothetical protein
MEKSETFAQPLLACSHKLFDPSTGLLQAMPKLALRAQTVDIANLPLRQDVLAKNRLNEPVEDISVWATACKDSTYGPEAV